MTRSSRAEWERWFERRRMLSALAGAAVASTYQPLVGLSSLLWAADSVDEAVPKSIGGKWGVREASNPTYLFNDAGRWVDPFSYHRKDSNEDGIENIRLAHDATALIIQSQGYPNHPTAIFPNSGNPNRIRVQNFTFRFPLQPQRAADFTSLPMGPIGMALNGVVFFNPFEIGGMNAVEGYSEVWLDSCCGHPEQRGVYHYHKYPSCVKSPFVDDGKRHSPIVGFAFDGFPVYGPYEGDGAMAKDAAGDAALDVCNGHSDAQRGYHYHVTPGRFPYIIGGYAGTPDPSNNPGLRRAGRGAIRDNASGASRQEAAVVSVTPGTAARGAKHRLRIELNPSGGRPPVPPDAPEWIQIGPYEAVAGSISRTGDIVSFDVELPMDANRGALLDCHLEFKAPRGGVPLVYKKNHAFRIVE